MGHIRKKWNRKKIKKFINIYIYIYIYKFIYKIVVLIWFYIIYELKVTLPEFEEYYKDLSSSIDCDDMFEGIVKSAWKIWLMKFIIIIIISFK